MSRLFHKIVHSDSCRFLIAVGVWGVAVFIIPCAPHLMLGINCPGCGLSRSVFYFVTGNLDKSLELHILGIPFLLLVSVTLVGKFHAVGQSKWFNVRLNQAWLFFIGVLIILWFKYLVITMKGFV